MTTALVVVPVTSGTNGSLSWWRARIQRGRAAARNLKSAPLELGFLALEVETVYREQTLKKYAEVIGVEPSRLEEYRWTASCWPEKFARAENLNVSYSHLRTLNGNAKKKQWAILASRKRWTHSKLCEEVSKYKGKRPNPIADPLENQVITEEHLREEFRRTVKRRGASLAMGLKITPDDAHALAYWNAVGLVKAAEKLMEDWTPLITDGEYNPLQPSMFREIEEVHTFLGTILERWKAQTARAKKTYATSDLREDFDPDNPEHISEAVESAFKG